MEGTGSEREIGSTNYGGKEAGVLRREQRGKGTKSTEGKGIGSTERKRQ